MPDKTEPPSSAPIDQIRTMAFLPMGLCAALELEIFTVLSSGPMSAEQIASEIGVKPRRLKMLLLPLVVGEYLELDNQTFSNAAISDYYLVKGKPNYLGGAHEVWRTTWSMLMQTAESIRTDTPQAKIDFGAMSKDELGAFLRGLHGTSAAAGCQLAENPVFASANSIVDVGGGSGGVCVGLCQAHSHLRSTVADFPSVLEVAADMIGEAGLESRIDTESANIVEGPTSRQHDVAIARALFQTMSVEHCRLAAHNIGASLVSGGTLLILGNICDDTLLSPLQAVLQNVAFINAYENGQGYAEQQYRGWLEEAGFVDITREPPLGGVCMMSARKV